MANVIIKTDEQKANTAKVLKDFGYNNSANREKREYAECIARKSNEAIKEMEGKK